MPSPTAILLIRHGQSTWNADGRWQGQADPPLSVLGELQAEAAARHLPDVDAIVASDLVRARRTAEIIAERAGQGPVVVDRRLREADVGPWTGLTKPEIDAEWPGYIASGRRPPGAEIADAVADRALAALTDVHAAHRGGRVLVVAHSGVIRSLEHRFDTLSAVPRNLGGRWFELDGNGVMPGTVVTLIDHDTVAMTAPESL